MKTFLISLIVIYKRQIRYATFVSENCGMEYPKIEPFKELNFLVRALKKLTRVPKKKCLVFAKNIFKKKDHFFMILDLENVSFGNVYLLTEIK